MATTTLVKDPISGTFMGNMNGSGRTMVDLNGGVVTPAGSASGKTDAYTLFNRNIANILTQIQNSQTQGNQVLGGAKDYLTSESVAPNGPQSFAPGIFSGSQVAGQEQLQQSFNPAITSINTQMANTGAALGNLKDSLGTMATIFQPREVAPGSSLVTPGGGVVKSGHQYQPQINPNTGLLDGFDITTGTWASQDGGSKGDSVVGGVDFSGQATSTGAYATDPNYAKAVSGIYQTLSSAYPTPTADTTQEYIAGHAKSSPVTGQMIMNAATQYKVDPNLLTAVLAHESDFGTAGAAIKTQNPGNVGNTDSGARRTFTSWQQGVNAAANELARRIVPSGTIAGQEQPATATSPVGGSFSQDATQKIKQLPSAYQSYVDSGPLGVAYINSDRVPDPIKPGLQTMASRAGIPFVQAADVGAIKSIETVLSNLDNMQSLAQNNLMSGVLGHLGDATLGQGAELLQTEWGRNLGLFDNYRDVAIKAVQALAGGAGSGLRINMGEIAANTQNLPKSTDNLENSMANIRQLRQLIYTQIATTFPYAQVKVSNPQGQTGTVPAGQLNEAIKKGYTVI